MLEKEDILNRQPFIDEILSIVETLSKEKRGISFAIDGDWGSGKTFVLEQLEKQLEPVQSEDTANDRYFLFHYNCWQYDYYDEPAVAIISAMLGKAYSINNTKLETIAKASWGTVKNKLIDIGNEFIKNRIGIDVVETINDFQTEVDKQALDNSSFDKWFSFKRTIDNTRKTIQEIASEKTVVLIVDELDRCMPNYSIKVLERLHHIFDGIDNVILIFAIDVSQLQHTVRSIFGNKDDKTVDRYLKKFINFELKLSYGDIQNNVLEKYQDYFRLFSNIHFPDDENRVKEIIFNLFKYSKIDIRNQEKMIEQARTVHRIVCPENNSDYSILLFELIVSFFLHLAPGTDLKVIPEINRVTYGGLDKYLGQDFLNLLKELEDSTDGNGQLEGNITDGYLKCNKTINLTFYYLYSLFSKETKYAGRIIKGSAEELEICRKFIKMKRLLI
ncbi:MAG: KAP family NTPase [Lachnospiraceae bacterium]|nr:KAP family NTPase [Lachnospiraceae bacterium]MCM1240621.1 KAP family NTPase [Lachnospiraceae bacterium]